MAQHLLPVGAGELMDREELWTLFWIRVRCFSRGRKVGLQPQSMLVLGGSNCQTRASSLWASLNQTHPAHWRNEQPGRTTLLSTVILLPFFIIFRALEGINDSPSCSLLAHSSKNGFVTCGEEATYIWELNNLAWSRLSAHRRSLSHLPSRPWQCLGPHLLATDSSPNQCPDFHSCGVSAENSYSEHPSPLTVGLLSLTTDHSQWVFCLSFRVGVAQLLSCTWYSSSHGHAETFNGLLIALITSQDERGIVGWWAPWQTRRYQ